jgi:hypothetical protein
MPEVRAWFWTIHPTWLRCSSVTGQQPAPSSRLASWAPRPDPLTNLGHPVLASLARCACIQVTRVRERTSEFAMKIDARVVTSAFALMTFVSSPHERRRDRSTRARRRLVGNASPTSSWMKANLVRWGQLRALGPFAVLSGGWSRGMCECEDRVPRAGRWFRSQGGRRDCRGG